MRITVVEAGYVARGIIAATDAAAAGFHYRGVGRQPPSPLAVEAR